MGNSSFSINYFTHAPYSFQVLSTVHQTRVSWILSVKKPAP